MKKLGQHFLKNRSALQKVASALAITPDDIIVEIGPGHGELTEFIIAAQPKKLILVEKDPSLCILLEKKFREEERIHIIEGDALKILPDIINGPLRASENFKIAGNIPYYITGHLLRVIGESLKKPDQCAFTIQKEVAERICAQPPRMNRLAASVQFWAKPHIVAILKSTDFVPAPKVDSAILSLKTVAHGPKDTESYFAILRKLFAQPRKTIGNNITAGTKQNTSTVKEKLSLISIDPMARPQNLTIQDIYHIAKMFAPSENGLRHNNKSRS